MKRLLQIATAIGLLAVAWHYWPASPRPWSSAEIDILQSLSLDSLAPLPKDASNAVADNARAAEFGHALFFDARMSSNGGISCATCHQPVRHFTDGLQKAQAIGTAKRNTPSIVGTTYSPWQYWDGRRDSQWSQALTPLEDLNEHNTDRNKVVALIASDPAYAARYVELFGALPDAGDAAAVNAAFANIGKALAAYERLLLPGRSRFDDYVAALLAGDSRQQDALFSDDEIVGLQLFIGAANCTQCHNGPLLSNNEFHNTGVIAFPGDVPDKGRVVGVREAQENTFSCTGPYSDDASHACAELEYVRTGRELIGAFRTPSLRNLGNTAPFMHKGQIASLFDVLKHYNAAPLAMIGHSELTPLQLRNSDLRQLEAFLLTLGAPPATDEKWLRAPAVTLAADRDQGQQKQ